MAKSFIPLTDGAFNAWQVNFISVLQDNLDSWGIAESQITPLYTLQTAWTTAYTAGGKGAKGVRSSQQVKAKNMARKSYVSSIRAFVKQWITGNTAVTADQRVALGVALPVTHRTPAPVPATVPVIAAEQSSGTQIILSFKQQPGQDGNSRRGKPPHVGRLEFCYKVGDPAPASVGDCNLLASATRSPLKLNFDYPDAGKKMYGFGRWVNTRNQPGPWTPAPVMVVIP